MSTIKLGKININRATYDYDTYVASICRSDSGFLRPYLATNTLEVDTFFGSFPFKGMLCKFIEDGIPVLLLPMLTPMSVTNRCTLRLNDTSVTPEFPYAYPKYGRRYGEATSGEEPPDAGVASGKKSYVHVLDFASVPPEALSDYYAYFITRAGGGADRIAVYPSVPPPEEGLPPQPVVEHTFYDYKLPVDLSGPDVKSALVKAVKDCVNGAAPVKKDAQGGVEDYYIEGAECLDIFDIILSNTRGFLSSHEIKIMEEDYDDSYGDSDGRVSHRMFQTFDDYKEAKWKEARASFRTWMASQDYLLCDTMLAVGVCTSIFDDMSTDTGGYKEFDSATESEEYLSEFEDRLRAVPGDGSGYEWYASDLPYYALCIRNSSPKPLLDFYNLEKFSTFTLRSPDMDAISRHTEASKVAEFVSKIKGSRGGGIKVGIEEVPEEPLCYRLSVSLGEYKELFDITTAEARDGYMHLNDVGGESALVEAKLFNYLLQDGRYVCTDDFEEEAADGEAYDEGRVDYSRPLPAGEWSLGRHSKEIFDYECACDTLGVLSDCERHPDFLLVNELDYGSDRHWEDEGGVLVEKGEDRNLGYLKKVLEYAMAKKTQALVRVDEFHYNPPDMEREEGGSVVSYHRIPTPLVTQESRILYFSGCYRHNGMLYPCFYPYAVNFLKGDYIKRLPYGVLYDVEDKYDKDMLSGKGINYLEYNNYYYCYKTVREPDGSKEPDATVRFVASKISRVFLNGKYDFVGIPAESLPSAISGKVSRARALLPVLGDVAYSHLVEGEAVHIFLCFTIPFLVNKEYRLNITLTTT